MNGCALPEDITVVSGGQTGADRGGLCGARSIGVSTGGWAPYRFLTENGRDPSLASFGLKDSHLGYVGRTDLNAKEADITLWFGKVTGSSGYYATRRSCEKHSKPFINTTKKSDLEIADIILKYYNERRDLTSDRKLTINVSGNRESKNPGIENCTRDRIVKILTLLFKPRCLQLHIITGQLEELI